MPLQIDNTPFKRKNPIKRNNKFFSMEDFELETDFIEECLEDANQTVILYQVDLDKTMVNDVYKEAKKNNIRFKIPVELPVIYEIEDAELKSYDTNSMRGGYIKTGKLSFSVLINTLKDYDCDIKKGDYIGIQITEEHREYFVVTNDGKVGTTSNKNTLYGVKPLYRKIDCAPVDETEFSA